MEGGGEVALLTMKEGEAFEKTSKRDLDNTKMSALAPPVGMLPVET